MISIDQLFILEIIYNINCFIFKNFIEDNLLVQLCYYQIIFVVL